MGRRISVPLPCPWLRYNSIDLETRFQHNRQRLISLLDIPQDVYLKEEEIQLDGSLRLVFSHDGHETLFPGKWLREHVYDQSEIRKKGGVTRQLRCGMVSSKLHRP